VPTTKAETQTEQQIETNEQQRIQNSRNRIGNLIVSELLEDIDMINVDYVRIVSHDDKEDIVLKEQKGKDTIEVIEKLMDRVEAQRDIQSDNWEKRINICS
jgi:hypothetical protein